MNKKPAHSYKRLLSGVENLLDAARHAAARSVNSVITTTYWEVGRRIVEFEQEGRERAVYGQGLLKKLSLDLGHRFGRGFGIVNLSQMRLFYQFWPGRNIFQTVSEKSRTLAKKETRPAFPLPWSHYVRLLSVEDPSARAFYETESLRGGWSVRQLDRQIATLFYERTISSRNKAAMLRKTSGARRDGFPGIEAELKDPFVLEFLDLKDEYSESDLERSLIQHLEQFILELGNDFCFIARQKRLRVGDDWYRIDLLFYHRRLRCLVVIDLKVGKFTHADAGQMNLYLSYARQHWAHAGENPPIGLILCTQGNRAVARYALDGLRNRVLAAEYRVALPKERQLEEALQRTQRVLAARQLRGRGYS